VSPRLRRTGARRTSRFASPGLAILLAGAGAALGAQTSPASAGEGVTTLRPSASTGTDVDDGVSAGDTWVVLETSAGDLVIDLFEEKAPEHAENFKKLVRQGYYDGSPFHRVIEGFMAQGGGKWAPGGGTRDAGYTLAPEIDRSLRHVRGTVAAARKPDAVNPGRRSSGSQFYVSFANTPWLDGHYTIFGHVVDGLDVLPRIARGPRAENGAVPPSEATLIERAWLKPEETAAPAATDHRHGAGPADTSAGEEAASHAGHDHRH